MQYPSSEFLSKRIRIQFFAGILHNQGELFFVFILLFIIFLYLFIYFYFLLFLLFLLFFCFSWSGERSLRSASFAAVFTLKLFSIMQNKAQKNYVLNLWHIYIFEYGKIFICENTDFRIGLYVFYKKRQNSAFFSDG